MKVKQFIELIVVWLALFLGALIALCLADRLVFGIVNEAVSTFTSVATFAAALSFAMYSFLENIFRDLWKMKRSLKPAAFDESVTKVASLRNELVPNGALILAMLILEKGLKGAVPFSELPVVGPLPLSVLLCTSARAASFVTAIWTLFDQVRGFHTASGLRDVIVSQGQPD